MKVFENPKTMFGIRVTDAVRELYSTSSITFGDGENARPIMEFEGNTYLMQYKVRGLYPAGRKWAADDKRFLEPIPMDEVTSEFRTKSGLELIMNHKICLVKRRIL